MAGSTALARPLALAAALAFALASGALAETPAADARDEAWATRLMEAKGRIDQARKRLDEATAVEARAMVAEDGPQPALEAARQAAQAELVEAEKALPALVEEARAAGVSPAVLAPYRYARSPAP